jgi:hypothetical protein
VGSVGSDAEKRKSLISKEDMLSHLDIWNWEENKRPRGAGGPGDGHGGSWILSPQFGFPLLWLVLQVVKANEWR